MEGDIELSEEAKKTLHELVDYAKSLGIVKILPMFFGDEKTDEKADAKADAKTTAKPTSEQKYYKYLIVVDFESTCWNDKTAKERKPEIIEFPAILMDVKTGEILSEFHQYVMPTEEPQLSEFCTNLTGITQATIKKSGVSIRACLKLFDIWLDDVMEMHQLILPKTNASNLRGNCAFASWSDWDFGVCLHGECGRKRLNKPTYFDQWIDIKHTYKICYMHTPKNFADALKNAKLEFEGREHSGIDDARNIARLAFRMAVNGIQYEITKDLRPHITLHRKE